MVLGKSDEGESDVDDPSSFSSHGLTQHYQAPPKVDTPVQLFSQESVDTNSSTETQVSTDGENRSRVENWNSSFGGSRVSDWNSSSGESRVADWNSSSGSQSEDEVLLGVPKNSSEANDEVDNLVCEHGDSTDGELRNAEIVKSHDGRSCVEYLRNVDDLSVLSSTITSEHTQEFKSLYEEPNVLNAESVPRTTSPLFETTSPSFNGPTQFPDIPIGHEPSYSITTETSERVKSKLYDDDVFMPEDSREVKTKIDTKLINDISITVQFNNSKKEDDNDRTVQLISNAATKIDERKNKVGAKSSKVKSDDNEDNERKYSYESCQPKHAANVEVVYRKRQGETALENSADDDINNPVVVIKNGGYSSDDDPKNSNSPKSLSRQGSLIDIEAVTEKPFSLWNLNRKQKLILLSFCFSDFGQYLCLSLIAPFFPKEVNYLKVYSHDFIFKLGLNVALTHQNRSYRDSETKENVEAKKRKQNL